MDDTVALVLLLLVAVAAGTAAAGVRPRAEDPRRWAIAGAGAVTMLGLLA